MKVNLLSGYAGNAITRQYKRNKHLTYAGAVAAGTCLGTANLFHSVDRTQGCVICGVLGLVILKDTIDIFSNLLKLAKPYDEICRRAKKIYKHK